MATLYGQLPHQLGLIGQSNTRVLHCTRASVYNQL